MFKTITVIALALLAGYLFACDHLPAGIMLSALAVFVLLTWGTGDKDDKSNAELGGWWKHQDAEEEHKRFFASK